MSEKKYCSEEHETCLYYGNPIFQRNHCNTCIHRVELLNKQLQAKEQKIKTLESRNKELEYFFEGIKIIPIHSKEETPVLKRISQLEEALKKIDDLRIKYPGIDEIFYKKYVAQIVEQALEANEQ